MENSLTNKDLFMIIAIFLATLCLMSFIIIHHCSAYSIYYDRLTFEAACVSLSTIDFDLLSPGTNIDGITIDGVTLDALNSSSLIVLNTSSFYNYSTSTPSNMISPGGINWDDENDDLRIRLDNGVASLGLDVLFQVPDGYSLTNVNFYASDDTWLGCTPEQMSSPFGNPGYQFVGLIIDEGESLISYLIVKESDDSPPDNNIGFDSITYASSTSNSSTPITEPGTLFLLFSGMLGILGIKKGEKDNLYI